VQALSALWLVFLSLAALWSPAAGHASSPARSHSTAPAAAPIPAGTCWLWSDSTDDANSVPAGAGPTPVSSGNLDTLDITTGGFYTDGKNLIVVLRIKNLSGVGGLPISSGDAYNPTFIFYKVTWNNANGHQHYVTASWVDPATYSSGLNPPNAPGGPPSPTVSTHADGWAFQTGYTYTNGITWDAITGDVNGIVDTTDNAIIMSAPLDSFQTGDSTGMNFQPDPIHTGDVITGITGASHQGAIGTAFTPPANIYWTAAVDGDQPPDSLAGWVVTPKCKTIAA
jgi:hypothetical protein